MSIESNTGSPIALSKIDQMDPLERLFGEVYIPPAVHRELLAKAGSEAARLDDAFLFEHTRMFKRESEWRAL